ncbi:hypothetical protein LJC33_05065 [Eubacteriales bacterium OttesenSCG-928-N13]|nr:hypothetical protein [Eubacteriales bacterium OttesenSCG-928-N13]
MAVIRYEFGDYLNTGTAESPVWSLMGKGFNSLDENSQAQTDTKAYISDKEASTIVKGYQTQFPYNMDLIPEEAALMAVYKVGRNKLTGAASMFDYVRVDLYETPVEAGVYPARKFNVSVVPDSSSGAGAEAVVTTGNLNANGDFVEGTFNITTRTFTEVEAA